MKAEEVRSSVIGMHACSRRQDTTVRLVDLGRLPSKHIRYGHVGACNLGYPPIVDLQEVFAEVHARSRQLTLKRIIQTKSPKALVTIDKGTAIVPDN